jgi:cysteine desulfuration protein SufE
LTPSSTALAELAADMKAMDRSERSHMLIEYADQFEEVPAAIATRPFAERNRAPRCESDAYVWVTDNPDGTLKLHFAVENPQGISAKAWAAILDETLSGHTPEQILTTDPELLFDIFGRDLSMGKGQGLLGMLELIQHEARRRLDARRAG